MRYNWYCINQTKIVLYAPPTISKFFYINTYTSANTITYDIGQAKSSGKVQKQAKVSSLLYYDISEQ